MAHAGAPAWVNGFETGISQIDCQSSFVSAQTVFETSSPMHGTYHMRTRRAAGTEGRCGLVSGLGLTGTYIIAGWYKFKLYNATYCAPTQDNSVFEIRDSSATQIAALSFSCTNLGSDYEVAIQSSGGSTVGAKQTIQHDTPVYFEIKVTTGNGNGVVGGRIGGVSVGSDATSRTISKIDSLMFETSSPLGNSSIEHHLDDVVVLSQSTYPGPVYVNMRKPDGNGGTGRNQWTKAGGGGIAAEWTSPQAVSLPNWAGKTTYAYSIADDTDGQTATLANWDSGSPTPVIDVNAATDIFGCRYSAWAGREAGTARPYAIYSYQGSKNSTTITSSADTLSLYEQVFAASGATVSDRLTNLNALEVGGEKTSTATGAMLYIEDVWVQCAWASPVGGSLFMWTGDDDD